MLNMHNTRLLVDTRRYQTNKSQINSNYRTQQPHFENHTTIGTEINNSKMDDPQNARYFRVEGQLRYHWGADQETMTFISRGGKSPDTSELVTRRIELAKTDAMRPHWNKNLGREIYVPRRPEENERREINRIDLQLKREKRGFHIGGGYFRDFGDEISQRAAQDFDQTNRNETHRENETYRDAESNTIHNY